MRKRHPNYRLVKTHRNYTVEEIACLYGIHKNTVHNWVKNGLATLDNGRPILIHGNDLAAFLQKRRLKNKQTCKPGELYCVRCRVPRPAGGGMAEYTPVNEKIGNLVAICPVCEAFMNRRVSLAKIGEISGNIDITFPEELRHIVDRTKLSVNCDLR